MNNFLSVFAGVLIAIMIMVNGFLSMTFGNYGSSVIIHLVGLISIISILFINKSGIRIHKHIPLYLYSAGAIGVFTVLFNNLSFSRLGVSVTLALGLLGQSLASIIIDHFGLLEMKIAKFQKEKYIGLLFIMLGLLIMTIF